MVLVLIKGVNLVEPTNSACQFLRRSIWLTGFFGIDVPPPPPPLSPNMKCQCCWLTFPNFSYAGFLREVGKSSIVTKVCYIATRTLLLHHKLWEFYRLHTHSSAVYVGEKGLFFSCPLSRCPLGVVYVCRSFQTKTFMFHVKLREFYPTPIVWFLRPPQQCSLCRGKCLPILVLSPAALWVQFTSVVVSTS